MGWAILTLMVFVGGLAVGVLLMRRRQSPGWAPAALEARLTGVSADLDRRIGLLDQRMHDGLESIHESESRAARDAAIVRERFVSIAAVTEQVREQAKEMVKLGDLLRPPQARGAFGELQLENLLAEGLPAGSWSTQHTFQSGNRVDAIIQLGHAIVPIDAKFPMAAFERMLQANTQPAQRVMHRRVFLRDASHHIDVIASKYICPDEGTLDFALCFVPSEAVWYEFLREDSPDGESVFRYAIKRRVFPVSPTTLYAYVMSISIGLRGLRVEANASRVLQALAGLQEDVNRFQADFATLGRHLHHAKNKWDTAARRLDRFDGKLDDAAERIGELTTTDQPSETLLASAPTAAIAQSGGT